MPNINLTQITQSISMEEQKTVSFILKNINGNKKRENKRRQPLQIEAPYQDSNQGFAANNKTLIFPSKSPPTSKKKKPSSLHSTLTVQNQSTSMASRFQAVALVASPSYPNSIAWSDDNFIAVASAHLVTILVIIIL